MVRSGLNIVAVVLLAQTRSLVLSPIKEKYRQSKRRVLISAQLVDSEKNEKTTSLGSVRLRALVSAQVDGFSAQTLDGRRSPFFLSATKKNKQNDLSASSLSALEVASGAALRAAALAQGKNETRFRSALDLARRQAPEYANALIEAAFGAVSATASEDKRISINSDKTEQRAKEAFRRLAAEVAVARDEVDFCLSLADRNGISAINSIESLTRRVNSATNVLLRAASYGDADDVEEARQAVLAVDTGSDDAARAYLDALASLATSEDRAAVTDNAFATLFYARGGAPQSESSTSLATRLGDAYVVALQRFLGELTRRGAVAGAGYSVVADDPSYLRTATLSTTKRKSQSGFSDPWLVEEDDPQQASSARITSPQASSVAKKKDTTEKIKSPTIVTAEAVNSKSIATIEEDGDTSIIDGKRGVLGFNFIEWEMRLRRELIKRRTKDSERALRPNDFVGTWQLVFVYDAPDDAGPLIPGGQESDREAAVEVQFAADGQVKVLSGPFSSSQKKDRSEDDATWRVRPGPAHLDTCEFNVDLRDAAGESLAAFCGYVDRGQRIESRFSKRPIRVSGFAYASLDDSTLPRDLDATPTGRFAMLGPVDKDRAPLGGTQF